MNSKTFEKETRRCRMNLWNPKKDLYAKRNTRYGCVDGKFILPRHELPKEEKPKIIEKVKVAPLSKWQRIKNWFRKLWKSL